MPKLVSLNEKYKEKGLVMVFVGYESKAKLEPYAKRYKIDWPIALEPTKKAQKAYGVRGFPSSFVIAPDGKVAWKGHPASKDLESVIQSLLSKVKKGSSGSGSVGENPTEIKFEKEFSKRLQFAARQAARGQLSSALRMAQKMLDDDNAGEDEKKEAGQIKSEIEKRVAEIFKEVERLLKEKMPYEAKQLLIKIRQAFSGHANAKKAQDKIIALDKDASLEDELKAGDLYVKGLKAEAEEDEKEAQKYFKQVVDNYPETEYAKRAKEKLK